jgi:CRP-like cAMP-binding protein
LKQNYYEKGMMILRERQEINSLKIVMHGEVEVYTDFEGHEFVIERLGMGSIFHHHQFLMDDIS